MQHAIFRLKTRFHARQRYNLDHSRPEYAEAQLPAAESTAKKVMRLSDPMHQWGFPTAEHVIRALSHHRSRCLSMVHKIPERLSRSHPPTAHRLTHPDTT